MSSKTDKKTVDDLRYFATLRKRKDVFGVKHTEPQPFYPACNDNEISP